MDKGLKEEQEAEYNINEVIRVRGDIYGFLSRGFRKAIDEGYLKDIEEIVPAFDMLTADTEDTVLKNGAMCLKAFSGSIKNTPEVLEELNRQYSTLLLGIVSEHMSFPCESVYLSPAHMVMQEQRNEVLEFYTKHNSGVVDDFKNPEDHVSAELSFISRLCALTLEDLGNDDMKGALEKLKAQKEFMYAHLLRWVHLLSTDLKKAAKAEFKGGFYECLADLTMGYARIDIKFLDGLIEMMEEQEKDKLSSKE